MRFTTLSYLCLACAASGVSGQSILNTNRVVKSLTESECIRLALEHNLRIQIRRIDPNIERYTLAASYGVYDPVFTADYNKSSRTTEGRFDPVSGVNTSASTSDVDALAAGFAGYLPSGLTYNMSGDIAHSRGQQRSGTFDNYISGVGISLAQPLLKNFWIDLSRLKIKIAKQNIKVSQYNLDTEIRIVVLEVQKAYYEVARALEEVKVQEKALELANALLAQNKEKVRVGTMAPLEEKLAEATAATTLASLIGAQRDLVTLENELKSLITDNYEAWLNNSIEPVDKLVAVPESNTLLQSMTDAITKRPDYQAAVVTTESQGIRVKYSYNQLFPELNLLGGYGYSGIDSSSDAVVNPAPPPAFFPAQRASASGAFADIADQNNPRWNFGALLRVPLSRKTERNNYQAAKQTLKQVELEMKKLHQTILKDVDNSLTSVIAAYESVGATRQARIYAESALDAEQKKLENGKSTNFDVLGLQEKLTKARSDEIKALADYNKALADLHYQDGTSLERKQISLQFK